jgi:DUF971 family protein
VLEIAWEGGARTRHPGRQLRWACPCAECRGEGGSAGRLDGLRELPDEELQLTDVALIGQYALQIAFASGHGTGIYTFRYLRQLGADENPPPVGEGRVGAG